MDAPAFPVRDVVVAVAELADALRAAGLRVNAAHTLSMLESLSRLSAADPEDVYWAGRLTMCSGLGDLDAYDKAFRAWLTPPEPELQERSAVTAISRRHEAIGNAAAATGAESPAPAEDPTFSAHPIAAAAAEQLRHRWFEHLTEEERRELNQLIARAARRPPVRPSRRRQRWRRGQPSPGDTVRASLRTGGELIELCHHRRRTKPRRVVVLVDVSRSMQAFADPLIRLAYAIHAAAPSTTYVYSVGTRLTDLSPLLRARDSDEALAGTYRAIADWSGGTRLSEGLLEFLAGPGADVSRGAVVILASDGCEQGDPDSLGRQVETLRRRCRRLIWVHPYAGRPGFEPTTGGLHAALPWIDRLLAGGSTAGLLAVLEELDGSSCSRAW